MIDALRLYVIIGPPATGADKAIAGGQDRLPEAGLDRVEVPALGPEPDPAEVAAIAALTRAAIDGGATMLQLRAKGRSTRDLLAFARAMLAASRPAGVPLLINDRVDIAQTVGADGVHVGPDDLPIEAARTQLGPDAIVGYSAGTPAQAAAAARRGANYVGVGDVFGTATKPDADAPIGLAGLRAVLRATLLPGVAIGGVGEGNAAEAIAAGAAGVAVVSAVSAMPDPRAAAQRLRQVVDAALARQRDPAADTPSAGRPSGAKAQTSPLTAPPERTRS